MNNEQQNNDERFTLEALARYILIHNENEKYFEVCWKDDDEPDGRTGRTRCRATYWYHQPPQTYSQKEAKEAAEAERDRLNDKHWLSRQIAKPRRVESPTVGIVKGLFSKPSPEFLSVAEKRRYLAEVFRSPEFTDADKFKALQEDNRMLSLFSHKNGKEQHNGQ